MTKPTDDKGIAHIHGSDGNDGDYEFTILPPTELDPRSNQTPLPDIDPDAKLLPACNCEAARNGIDCDCDATPLPDIDPDNPDTEHECPPASDAQLAEFFETIFPGIGIRPIDLLTKIHRLERIILYNSGRTEAITKGEYEQHILDMVGEMEE